MDEGGVLMETQFACPHCNSAIIDIHDYESMIVITPDYALFSNTCPHCKTRMSTLRPIPKDMLDEVLYAAIEVDAGMGLTS